MCSGKSKSCKSFHQLSHQATSILEALCREDTWDHISKNNRMALMRLLSDLVAGMIAAVEIEQEEGDTA